MAGERHFGAVDVFYPGTGGARAALVVCADDTFATITAEYVTWLDRVTPYQPGRFFLRELPAIEAVLGQAGPLDLLVVDGFVDLDPEGRPGLGARVHEAFGGPVVGVAKSSFPSATHAVPVRRGVSVKPLYITAAGIAIESAAALVARMSGRYRIPDALRRVDSLSRGHTGRHRPSG